VSEVEDWILPDLVRHIMDKETEQRLIEMMESLFARQSEKIKARQEKAAARQEKANAELKAAQAEMKADIIAKIEAGQKEILALFRGSRTYGKGTTTCQTETSCSEEMEATNLEVTPEETEAAVERQELFKEETNFENMGSSEDRSGYRRLVLRRRREATKRIQDSVGSRQKLSAARKRLIRRVIRAVRKGNIRKGPSKNSTARGAPKGPRLQKTQRICQECKTGCGGNPAGTPRKPHDWRW
jgi:hypothetical protein